MIWQTLTLPLYPVVPWGYRFRTQCMLWQRPRHHHCIQWCSTHWKSVTIESTGYNKSAWVSTGYNKSAGVSTGYNKSVGGIHWLQQECWGIHWLQQECWGIHWLQQECWGKRIDFHPYMERRDNKILAPSTHLQQKGLGHLGFWALHNRISDYNIFIIY
jgi:hypothetical protein